MTVAHYLSDPSLSGVMTLTALLDDGRRARFAGTWFHPQGGGQKADRGRIGTTPIGDVRHAPDGGIDHLVDVGGDLEVGRSYPFEIDRDWRRLNSAFHTGAHLLAGVVQALHPSLTIAGGHQWPGEARVEFSGPDLHAALQEIDRVSEAIGAAIAADLPVEIVNNGGERACRIGGFPAVPCSGTHLGSTGQLGVLSVRAARVKGGRLRIGYEVAAKSAGETP